MIGLNRDTYCWPSRELSFSGDGAWPNEYRRVPLRAGWSCRSCASLDGARQSDLSRASTLVCFESDDSSTMTMETEEGTYLSRHRDERFVERSCVRLRRNRRRRAGLIEVSAGRRHRKTDIDEHSPNKEDSARSALWRRVKNGMAIGEAGVAGIVRSGSAILYLSRRARYLQTVRITQQSTRLPLMCDELFASKAINYVLSLSDHSHQMMEEPTDGLERFAYAPISQQEN